MILSVMADNGLHREAASIVLQQIAFIQNIFRSKLATKK
jgi:hypothetical protein